MDDAIRVRAPLRYGRRSKSRDCTYTMVFASSCVEDGVATGVALAVPFRDDLECPQDLLDEALCLWRVESNEHVSPRGAVSASWGSVALQVNPGSRIDPSYLDAWSDLVGRSPKYGSLTLAEGEPSVLDRDSGLATFPWPPVVDTDLPLALDAVLLTATDPEIVSGRYPDAAKVAEAWNLKKHRAEYFWKNRAAWIRTVDDAAIEALLESS